MLASLLCQAGPVSYYGALTTSGNKIRGNGMDVQLKGPSFFWSDGSQLSLYNANTVDWFVDTMDVSVIRHAMMVQYYNSQGNAENPGADAYLASEDNKTAQKNLIETMVQAAIRNDIYIIIDWHSHRAQNEQQQAMDFFAEMATKYKGVPNVIFEIYNEPPGRGSVPWSSIRNYMWAVINTIRATGNGNLILVGSPQWSSDPHTAASESWHNLNGCAPGTSSPCGPIAYTMHFYAGTHTTTGSGCNSGVMWCSQEQYNNANTTLNTRNAAVFVSEWGTTSASGSGDANAARTREWTTWMNTNKVSSCQWSVSGHETSSIFDGTMSLANLSASGRLLHEYMGGSYSNPASQLGKTDPPAGWPWARSETVRGLAEGQSITWTKGDLDLSSGAEFHSGEVLTPSVVGEFGELVVTPDEITFTAPYQSATTIYINFNIREGSNISKHRITLRDLVLGPRATVDRLNVSLTGTTVLNVSDLGISNPNGSITAISFLCESGSGNCPTVTAGDIAKTGDRRLTYTPPAGAVNGQEVILTFTITDGARTLTRDVVLVLVSGTPVLQPQQPLGGFGLSGAGNSIFVNLAHSGLASLEIYSISGAKAKTLMTGSQNPGSYQFSIAALPKGVYIARLKQGSEVKTLKFVRN